MGDRRRFDLFARLIKNNFSPKKYKNIADVAGGKGYLQISLKENGFPDVTTFDKRHKKIRNIKFNYKFFSSKIKEKFDLIVGMHPDEATDVIIVEAAKRRIPFVVCPCCIKPSAILNFCRSGQPQYTAWISHLIRESKKRNYEIFHTTLPMQGKNDVLIGRPKK